MPEPGRNRITRRRMLKRIGAGAAVAWSAPVLSSLRAPAFAQATPVCAGCTDFECAPPIEECGAGAGGFRCFCDQDLAGNCQCLNDAFCSVLLACGTGGLCPPNFHCIPTSCCAEPKCIPRCGIVARARTAGEVELTWSGSQE
jgi:hypothetical protein